MGYSLEWAPVQQFEWPQFLREFYERALPVQQFRTLIQPTDKNGIFEVYKCFCSALAPDNQPFG
jgi:hypothetical protein